MNGWMRIWVVSSVLWVIVVVTNEVPRLPDTNITDSMILKSEADPDATWEEVSNDEFPTYSVTMRWEDGTSIEIEFPTLDEEEIKQVENKIKSYSVTNDKNYSSEALEDFLIEVKSQNSEARRINRDYLLLLAELNNSQKKKWWNGIWTIIAYSVGGSVIMLLSGYTIFWIKNGFRSET